MDKFVSCNWKLRILKICTVLFYITSAGGQEEQCDVLAAKFALEDLNTVVDSTHRQLVGTWLSEGCEIGPGPQYSLRSYTFHEDGTYKLIRHSYSDESCSSPKSTITSVGLLRLTKQSVYNLDASTGVVRPISIILKHHGLRAVEERISINNCSDFQWETQEEYLSYSSGDKNQDFPNNNLKNFTNISCFKNFIRIFDEFRSIKIQIRPVYFTITDNPTAEFHKLELLLGDIYSNIDGEENYSTTFQSPLIKWPSEHEIWVNGKYYKIKNICTICSTLEKSGINPPHFSAKASLVSYDIDGSWISMRCEIWPMGLYARRSFSFVSYILYTWHGELKFYLDPFCTVPIFSFTTIGDYTKSWNIFGPVLTNIDLSVGIAQLTIFDRKMSEEMSKANACDIAVWDVDTSYTFNLTHPCSIFNIEFPITQYGFIKFDRNYEGALLYLDLVYSSRFSGTTHKVRTSSYHDALIKCTRPGSIESTQNSWTANTAYLDSNSINSFNYNKLFSLLITFIVYVLCQT